MSSAQPHSRTPVPTSPSSPAPSSSSPPVPADPRDGGLGLCLTIAAWRDTASTPGQQTREPAGVADFTAEQLGPRELRRPALWVSNASGRPPAATGGSPTRSGWPGRRSSRAGSQPGAVVAGPFRRWQRSCGRRPAPRTPPGASTVTNRVGCAATRSASSYASVTHRVWTPCGQRAGSNGEDEQAGTATLRRSDRVQKLHDHQRVVPAFTASPASHSLDPPRLTPTPTP